MSEEKKKVPNPYVTRMMVDRAVGDSIIGENRVGVPTSNSIEVVLMLGKLEKMTSESKQFKNLAAESYYWLDKANQLIQKNVFFADKYGTDPKGVILLAEYLRDKVSKSAYDAMIDKYFEADIQAKVRKRQGEMGII